MKILLTLTISIFILLISFQLKADTSAQDTARAYYEGKTVRSNWNGGKLTVKFKKNGRVFGTYNQWTSSGKYVIDKNGTTCVTWDNPQWKRFCHVFGTGAAKID